MWPFTVRLSRKEALMSEALFRFVHASDFHLDAPLAGVCDVPAHLRDIFVDAPLQAAEKVVDTVLNEEVDIVILAGGILAADRSGPREILFLADQFERLAERKIPVYWLSGPADPTDEWSSRSLLPDNVHLFPCGKRSEVVVRAGDRPLARLIALGSRQDGLPTDDAITDDGLFSIVVGHGSTADQDDNTDYPADYWAFGGCPQPRSIATSPANVRYSGAPQARRSSQTGEHGCSLVEVDQSHNVHITPVATDAIRWHHEQLDIDPSVDIINLELQARERLQRLMVDHASHHLLIEWTIRGTGPLMGALRRGKMAADLVSKLRAEFGHHSPALWTTSIVVQSADGFPAAWYDEETMLGEFLRNVRRLEAEGSETIDLGGYLQGLPADVARGLKIMDPRARRDVLRRAATLGADMLRGEDMLAGGTAR
jgi:hypothetical protein